MHRSEAEGTFERSENPKGAQAGARGRAALNCGRFWGGIDRVEHKEWGRSPQTPDEWKVPRRILEAADGAAAAKHGKLPSSWETRITGAAPPAPPRRLDRLGDESDDAGI